ncbi:MAG: hypothetical protein J2P20_04685 [Pseudonocardia sp.]|nr:hypothetical protein [Pseudonocardia sp.]
MALSLVVVIVLGSACSGAAPPPGAAAGAGWVVAENDKPGTPGWQVGAAPAGGHIEGFANRVDATRGEAVTLSVSSTAPTFRVEAYRLGYYHGVGARLVWRSLETPGRAQPACPVTPDTHMVSCDNWAPSLTVPIGDGFVPGDYLFKLVGSGGQQSYVPLTVWDPNSHATYLVKNDVFTWQAWNPYGGYDYYVGQGRCPPEVYPLCSRARVVSYDRPYGDEQGTGDFLWLEAPLVRYMEQNGLDVSYVTDVTVAEHPEILRNHRMLMSLGHDECWSLPERQAAVAAERGGLNLGFFGASGILRHVRTQPSPLGADRQLVDYRDSKADPLNGKADPRQVTGNTWSAPPASWPEADFVGESYNGFLEPGVTAALAVTDAGSWIFAGTGLRDGQQLPGVIGSDVDSLEPPEGRPPNVRILAHSALPAGRAQPRTRAGPTFYSDMTYYTDPVSKAGIWDSGTNNWIPALDASPAEPDSSALAVRAVTANLLAAMGRGPAGQDHPSTPNWRRVYTGHD